MLATERQQKIMGLLNERGSVSVVELSQLFGVTLGTIRRDLDSLESEGKVQRSHGGAMQIPANMPDTPYRLREIANAEEKQAIAQEALKHIVAEDKIVLDGSTTVCCLAKMLPNIPLTVLTNSVKVVSELSGKDKIQVICTGGLLFNRALSFVGPLAERTMESYRVNKAFISCKGLHMQYGVSDSNELQALVKKKMMAISDKVYLLIDYSKFGMQDFTQLEPVGSFSTVITDSRTDPQYIRQLKEQKVPVIQTS